MAKYKLTMPQYCLLVDISDRPEVVYEHYRPGMKLLELGFATSTRTCFGHIKLTITDAGKEWLSSH